MRVHVSGHVFLDARAHGVWICGALQVSLSQWDRQTRAVL